MILISVNKVKMLFTRRIPQTKMTPLSQHPRISIRRDPSLVVVVKGPNTPLFKRNLDLPKGKIEMVNLNKGKKGQSKTQ